MSQTLSQIIILIN